MKLKFIAYALLLMPFAAFAADPTPPVFIRPAVFSTSTDWESVTGLRLRMYTVRITNATPAANRGWEMYFLDGFPCYAQSEGARTWVSSNDFKDARFLITCLYAPDAVGLAWRSATRTASQGVTTGLLICPITASDRDMTIDLSKCTQSKEWKDVN